MTLSRKERRTLKSVERRLHRRRPGEPITINDVRKAIDDDTLTPKTPRKGFR